MPTGCFRYFKLRISGSERLRCLGHPGVALILDDERRATMRIRILSDLHLEVGPAAIRDDVDCDVVVLAGDIDSGTNGLYWAREEFDRPVIYVPGNHEYYHHDIVELAPLMRETANRLGIHLLDNEEVTIQGQRFLGTPLWPGLPREPVQRADTAKLWNARLNDFRCIRAAGALITPEHMSRWHAGSIRFLKDAINDQAPAVVVSHFAPTVSMQNPSFAGDALTSYFQNDLDELIGPGVALWVYGHNHHSCDRVVSGTRVVSNQRGCPGESTGFDPGKTVDISTPSAPR